MNRKIEVNILTVFEYFGNIKLFVLVWLVDLR